MPETLFIDRAGIIRYKHVGPIGYELLTDQIQHFLAEPRRGASP